MENTIRLLKRHTKKQEKKKRQREEKRSKNNRNLVQQDKRNTYRTFPIFCSCPSVSCWPNNHTLGWAWNPMYFTNTSCWPVPPVVLRWANSSPPVPRINSNSPWVEWMKTIKVSKTGIFIQELGSCRWCILYITWVWY